MNRLTTAASLILCLTVLCCSLFVFFMLCLLEIRDIYYTCMQFLWCCYYCCLFLDKEADTSKVHKFKNLSHSNYTELYPLFLLLCVLSLLLLLLQLLLPAYFYIRIYIINLLLCKNT